MSSLYNISQELILLRNMLEVEDEFAETDQEQVEQINNALEIEQQQLVEKSEGYIYVIRQVEAQAEGGEKEIERIKKFIARKKHIAERMKGALLQALLLFGEEDKNGVRRLEVGTNTLSTRRSSSVDITDPEQVTDDCKNFDVVFKSLDDEMKAFLIRRIHELPSSEGKNRLLDALNISTKVSKTAIKAKIQSTPDDDLGWAEIVTKYSLVIK